MYRIPTCWRNTLQRDIPQYLRWIRRWRTWIRARLIWPLVASHSPTLELARGILEREEFRKQFKVSIVITTCSIKAWLQFQMGNSFYVTSAYPLLWLSFALFVLLCSCQIRKKMGTWGMPTSSFLKRYTWYSSIFTWLLDTAVKRCSESCWNLFPDPVLLLLYHTGTWLLK